MSSHTHGNRPTKEKNYKQKDFNQQMRVGMFQNTQA
jgi:hypothetical protein